MDEHNVVSGAPEEKSSLPLISMILGIAGAVLSVLFWCCAGYFVGVPLGIAALILAITCKQKGITQDKGYTLTGLITGIVCIVAGLAAVVYWIVYGAVMIGSMAM
ncbi:MAG: hypothetical protein FWC70_02280 [Defluviitaleaceae bacterium]|nr:hypothetical protein [Defluviitaleaceae bacterium]